MNIFLTSFKDFFRLVFGNLPKSPKLEKFQLNFPIPIIILYIVIFKFYRELIGIIVCTAYPFIDGR